jgi:hypothetical protein
VMAKERCFFGEAGPSQFEKIDSCQLLQRIIDKGSELFEKHRLDSIRGKEVLRDRDRGGEKGTVKGATQRNMITYYKRVTMAPSNGRDQGIPEFAGRP